MMEKGGEDFPKDEYFPCHDDVSRATTIFLVTKLGKEERGEKQKEKISSVATACDANVTRYTAFLVENSRGKHFAHFSVWVAEGEISVTVMLP